MTPQIKQQLEEKFPGQVKFDEPLSKHSTFKIGGTADIFLMPNTTNALVEAFRFIVENKLPYFILGGGANVLLPDEGFRGIVLHPKNRGIHIEGTTVRVDAGLPLAKLAGETAKAGLTGLEWCIAVPGSVGGAVRGNAGAFGGEIKDTLVSARIFDGKEMKTLSNEALEFSYRSSRVKKHGGKEIVLDAVFTLTPALANEATQRMKDMLKKKTTDQPMGELCAGCLFKNIELVPGEKALAAASTGEPTEQFFADIERHHPEFIQNGKVPAGWIIEQLGFKQRDPHKGIMVSEKHANFLVNTGTGNAAAVKEYAEMIKQKVKDVYGVELEEEVEMV